MKRDPVDLLLDITAALPFETFAATASNHMFAADCVKASGADRDAASTVSTNRGFFLATGEAPRAGMANPAAIAAASQSDPDSRIVEPGSSAEPSDAETERAASGQMDRIRQLGMEIRSGDPFYGPTGVAQASVGQAAVSAAITDTASVLSHAFDSSPSHRTEPLAAEMVASEPLRSSFNSASTVQAASFGQPTIPSGAGLEILFITGVNFNGVVASTSFGTWNGDAPATYNTRTSSSFKWGNSQIGTAGGNVTYWFDTPSNWSTTEQNGFLSGLALWSAEANISFSVARDQASANVVFQRNSSGVAVTGSTVSPGNIGSGLDGTPQGQVTISIDPSVAGFGPIGGAFSRFGGYPYDTLVHEEGHMLGFGHGGAYNAGDGLGSVPARQFSVYDSRLWTIMSYIEPSDATATFFNSYPVKGTSWGTTQDPSDNLLYNNDPTTPMMLDIIGAQLLYGTPTSGPLVGGGQHFGFNCNIPGSSTDASIRRYFDFSINTTPIVTLWDAGTNNTLDVSGWSTSSTINLDPGTFSSCDGLANNIGIANGTTIETAIGGSGSDTITGSNVSNTLSGGDGNDFLYGGDSSDGYIADADTLKGGGGADHLDGGAGVDTAEYIDSGSGVTVNLVTGTGSGGTAQGDTLVNIENLDGSLFNDTLTGNASSQILNGEGGNDTLIANNGTAMYGGYGDDTYVVNSTANLTLEFADQGHDTVRSSVGWVLDANIEDLVLTGTASVNGFGNELNNAITGNSGDNYLQGYAGADVLAGGRGNDYYELGDLHRANNFAFWQYDRVVEAPDAGIDTVSVTALRNPDFISTPGYTLGANIENGIIQGTSDFNLEGNELDNRLTGNSAANVLTGYDRNDTLNGGAGLDTLVGGAGNDVYVLNDVNFIDDFTGWEYDTVTEAANAGIDTEIVTPLGNSNFSIDANVENANVVGAGGLEVIGNALNNVINGNGSNNLFYGQDGNDTLDGGAGIDTLIGGAGNDTYILNDISFFSQTIGFAYDVVSEAANGGTDTVIVTPLGLPAYDLSDNVENVKVVGAGALQVVGNDLKNAIIGNADSNVIFGEGGNDRIDGGGGADTMIGGIGSDTYFVDNSGDVVSEGTHEGYDTVHSTVSFSIGTQSIERLVLDGVSAINGTGSSFGNTIIGNLAANVIDGGGGADIMSGGAGNDTYYVNRPDDQVIELANAGIDTIRSSVSLKLVDNVERLSLLGSSALNGFGNNLDNVIQGNAGGNILAGGGGNDTLTGYGGGDAFVFHAGFGLDRITDFAAGILPGHDRIKIDDMLFANYSALLAHTADVHGSSVITYDSSDKITLLNVQKTNLTGADFTFA